MAGVAALRVCAIRDMGGTGSPTGSPADPVAIIGVGGRYFQRYDAAHIIFLIFLKWIFLHRIRSLAGLVVRLQVKIIFVTLRKSPHS